NSTRYEFPLAGDRDPTIYFRYYEEAFCNYKRARFTTGKKPGIDLAQLPEGTYRLLLRLATHGVEAEAPVRTAGPIRAESHQDGRLYRFRSSGDRALLDVRPVVGRRPAQAVFRMRKSWARGPLVHVDGDFAVRGVEIPDKRTASYYLVLRGADGAVHSRALVCSGLDGAADAFGDGVGDYSGARFGTPKRAGVDVSGLRPGQYDVEITLSCGGALYTVPAGKTVRISAGSGGTVSAGIRNAGGWPPPAALRGLRLLSARDLRHRLRRRVRRRLSRLLPR
ncbi:hypothetical protein HER39_05025, partial [Arthrobacter deserti]|nr:hypothetical protein [Arthrobacter deserti]